MWSNRRLRTLVQIAAIGGIVVSMAGCESVRDAMGVSKQPPDEFAVVTKAPLIIPPDYNLKPPKPGAAPLNQVSPTESAQAALYSDDPNTVAGTITGNYSDGEKMLMAQTGAAAATDSIRQQIAADNANQQSADESFTDHLLFGGGSSDNEALNADAEKARIDPNKTAQPAEQAQIKKDDSGGWLDGIF
ncbi:MAG TPA: DUF3035 domain-containing protein [Rhizomicrobium sp.]